MQWLFATLEVTWSATDCDIWRPSDSLLTVWVILSATLKNVFSRALFFPTLSLQQRGLARAGGTWHKGQKMI